MKILRVIGLSAAIVSFAATVIAKDVGVSKDTVAFGQIAALDGPVARLGLAVQTGILAAFKQVNDAKGGVEGRKLTLDSRNDDYLPDRSVAEINKVVSEDSLFALIGTTGTATNMVMQPIATKAGIPMVGLITGAGVFRNPDINNLYNLRNTYGAETAAVVAHLVDKRGYKNIAIFYQDDSFGKSGLNGVEQALSERGVTLIAEGTYARNTTNVKDAMVTIREANPEAVVMIGTYKPVAEFIKLSRSFDFKPEFVSISVVGARALADELWPEGEGVIISQVVPFPWDDSLPIVKDYQAAITAYDEYEGFSFFTFEGYLIGRLVIKALEDTGADLTRDNFLSSLEAMSSLDLGGLTLTFGPDDNQGIDKIFMTKLLPDGFLEPM